MGICVRERLSFIGRETGESKSHGAADSQESLLSATQVCRADAEEIRVRRGQRTPSWESI